MGRSGLGFRVADSISQDGRATLVSPCLALKPPKECDFLWRAFAVSLGP